MQGLHYVVSGPLRWREFDGQWVVYNAATGALQAPDAVTSAVLSVLESGPASSAELVQQVAAANGIAVSQALACGMDSLLDELQRIGMVEPLLQ